MNIEEYAQLAYKNARKKADDSCALIYSEIMCQYARCVNSLENLPAKLESDYEDTASTFHSGSEFFHSDLGNFSRDNLIFNKEANDRETYHNQISALQYAKSARGIISLEEASLAHFRKIQASNVDLSACKVDIVQDQKGDGSSPIDQNKLSEAVSYVKKICTSVDPSYCRKTLENGGNLLSNVPYSIASDIVTKLRYFGFDARFKIFIAEQAYEKVSNKVDEKFNHAIANTKNEIETFQKRSAQKRGFIYACSVLALTIILSIVVSLSLQNEGYTDINIISIIATCVLISSILVSLVSFILPLIFFPKRRNRKKTLNAIQEKEEMSLELFKRDNIYKWCGDVLSADASKAETIYNRLNATLEKIFREFTPIYEENARICAAKTAFLPPLVEGELLDCVIEQMEKGMATNFKDALWQATQILERKKEQERTLAREREAERERREREARRDAEERAHRQALEQYAREQAEAQQRQLAELERQSEIAKKSAEDAKKAQEEAAKEARRQTDIANEQLDLERKRETDRIWDRLHRN